jgi:hypothetical protein
LMEMPTPQNLIQYTWATHNPACSLISIHTSVIKDRVRWISLKLIIGLKICNNDYNHLLFVQQHEPVLVHNVIAILKFEARCLGTTLLPVLVIKLCKLTVVGLRESTAMLPQHNPWV